ncbi:MAG: hypothetical protein PHQ28_06750 [Mycobacterium sp.]|nr:hypothetical protein [Mycobacterium sp.]
MANEQVLVVGHGADRLPASLRRSAAEPTPATAVEWHGQPPLLIVDETCLLERLKQPGGRAKRRGVDSCFESTGISIRCQGLQDGAAGTGRTEHDLRRFRRADRYALGFDSHSFDEPFHGFLDDLDAHTDCAVRGGSTLLVRGASTSL